MTGQQRENLPTPDQLDEALRALWQGSPEEFDRLVDGGRIRRPGTCALLSFAIARLFVEPSALDEREDSKPTGNT